jgi:hypothetical protein
VQEPDIERALKKWDPQYGNLHNNLDKVIEDMAAEDLRANSYNVIGDKSKSSSNNQKTSNEN